MEDDRFCRRIVTPCVRPPLLLGSTCTVRSVFMSSPCVKLWGDSSHWPLSGHRFTNTPLWSWGLSVKRTRGWGRGKRKSVNCLSWSDSRKRDVSQFFLIFFFFLMWANSYRTGGSHWAHTHREPLGDSLSPEDNICFVTLLMITGKRGLALN